MLIRAEKPITKEQFMRAQMHGGTIDPVDMDAIFSNVEQYNYGVFSPIACARYSEETHETTYIVTYSTSDTCD
jgi:hypothetical protein